MKILTKANIIKHDQVEHTKTERRVLGCTRHPFILPLRFAFQTRLRLFIVLDYCPGGELFYHLNQRQRFPESMARFYAAEIILALEHLHKSGVVYRVKIYINFSAVSFIFKTISIPIGSQAGEHFT